MQFSTEELKNLAVLLERITLNGKEALPVAQLQLKIQNLIKESESSLKTTSKTTGTSEVKESMKENENPTPEQI